MVSRTPARASRPITPIELNILKLPVRNMTHPENCYSVVPASTGAIHFTCPQPIGKNRDYRRVISRFCAVRLNLVQGRMACIFLQILPKRIGILSILMFYMPIINSRKNMAGR